MARTNKEYYKYGIYDYYKLQKEMSSIESITVESDSESENLFEEWYDKRAGQIATLSEEEKERLSPLRFTISTEKSTLRAWAQTVAMAAPVAPIWNTATRR